jgi:hypothetical protein
LTSSPGQMQIPERFHKYFPDTVQTREADSGGAGRQWEVSLPARFLDGSYTKVANGRFVIYEPKTGAPRSNTEGRFTFLDREISNRLSRSDMLVYRFPKDRSYVEVERFSPGSATYRKYYPGGNPRWGDLPG